MAQTDPPRFPPGENGPPVADPLEELRERVRLAHETAQKIAQETAGAARDAEARRRGAPPGSGFAVPSSDGDGDGDGAASEAQALVALVELVRSLIPREISEPLTELVRELLLLARTLIDWYVERTDPLRRRPVEVEDIPIA